MGRDRSNHNLKRRLKLIEKQTGKPWLPGTKQTHGGNAGWWQVADSWNDASTWGQSHRSKGTWNGSRTASARKFSKRDQKAANQKTEECLHINAQKKKEKKTLLRKAKKTRAKLMKRQLSEMSDASAGEQPKLCVTLKKDVRRKMNRSKNRAQTDTQTYTDTGAAGPTLLNNSGVCERAMKKKMGKKRMASTYSSAATLTETRALRVARKSAAGTVEESQIALEGANRATSTLPGSKPKKAAKRQGLRNVLIEEAMRREKLSAKTGHIGGEPKGKIKKVKHKTKGVGGKLEVLRNGASVGSILSNTSGRPLSKKERLRAKLGIQKRMRQKACVICPGSVTDRVAQQHLNGSERRLLATGGLSWRWFREPFDPERLPGASQHKPDGRAHQVKLDMHLQYLPEPAARKLCWLDECLETYACWPPCIARAALAVRLRKKGALRKQCERHFAEVIEPLLAPTAKASTTDHTVEGASLQISLLLDARRICTACAEAWHSLAVDGLVQLEGSGTDARSAWWQMICCAISADLAPRCKGPRSAWLRALQHAIFARLCPEPSVEVRQRMLQAAVDAAGTDLVERTAEAQQLPLVLLPLGTFTFWQVLLLAAAAHWLGTGSTVLRRTAAGPPEVVWRSSTREHPAAAAGQTAETLP